MFPPIMKETIGIEESFPQSTDNCPIFMLVTPQKMFGVLPTVVSSVKGNVSLENKILASFSPMFVNFHSCTCLG